MNISGNLSDLGNSSLGGNTGGLGQQSAQSVCPCCGYCPACGRHRDNFQPYNPYPYSTQPYYGDPVYVTYTAPNTGTATCSGGNTQNRM